MSLVEKTALTLCAANLGITPVLPPASAAELPTTEIQKTVACPSIPNEQRLVYTIHHPLTGVSIILDKSNPLSAYIDVTYAPDEIKESITVTKELPEYSHLYSIQTEPTDNPEATRINIVREVPGSKQGVRTLGINETGINRQMRRTCFDTNGFVKFNNTNADNPASIEP